MGSKRLLRGLVFGALLAATPALASHPPNPDVDPPFDQYEEFDRETTEIYDQKTTLTWERKNVSRISRELALAELHCANDFGGGRIPTIKELQTILSEFPHEEYEGNGLVTKMIFSDAFPAAPVGAPYWSSTPHPAGGHWGLSFANGAMAPIPAGGAALVRCVR